MDSEVLQSDKSIQTEKRNAENNETNEEKVKISRKCFNIKCLVQSAEPWVTGFCGRRPSHLFPSFPKS